MIPALWGTAPGVTDQDKCWAEVGQDGAKYTIPCGKKTVSAIGLCPTHFEEITGRVWDGREN